jgi:hypothetical protein
MKLFVKNIILLSAMIITSNAMASASADKNLGVCLNSYQDQNAVTPRYFNINVKGTMVTETAEGIELQTSTAWMNQNFMLAEPLHLAVYETTSGVPVFLCATDLTKDQRWVNVTVNPNPAATDLCEFTFKETSPDPSCFPGPVAN